jgi:hypothetical protein
MSARLAAIARIARVGALVLGAGCSGHSSSPVDASPPDAGLVCEPADADRGACRSPLETSLCAARWDDRPSPMCGLRVYEGPGAGYLLQYVSFSDEPPVGGPTWMCIYDAGTRELAGVWALDHYLRWCCGTSLDMFEGVATNDLAALAVSMATHPLCPDVGSDASP